MMQVVINEMCSTVGSYQTLEVDPRLVRFPIMYDEYDVFGVDVNNMVVPLTELNVQLQQI